MKDKFRFIKLIFTGTLVAASLTFAQIQSESTADSVNPGPLVSNVFFETDLRQALKDLANETGIAIIPDNSVQGLVTLEFNNIALEIVLDKILKSGGFTFRKINDYYLVGAAIPENTSFPFLTETEFYHPNYLQADHLFSLLSPHYQPFVRINDKINSIAITAAPEVLRKIKNSLQKLDVPPQQISIEAIITELSKEAKTSLGLDWAWLGESNNKNLGMATNLNSIINDSSLVTTLIKSGINYKSFRYDLILSLKALANQGKAKIKANPKVTTINSQEATIFIGSERYFSIVTGPVNYPYTRLEQIPVGITLKILPRISSDNEITAMIECEVSEVSEIGISGLPLVTKRKTKTQIRVKSDEIIAIGGLNQEQDLKTQKKIPFLGSIPVLGYLFSHTKTEKVEKEIAIFIAPHLVTESTLTPDEIREK